MKRIRLSDHFTCRKLLLFSLPSIGMQLICSSHSRLVPVHSFIFFHLSFSLSRRLPV